MAMTLTMKTRQSAINMVVKVQHLLLFLGLIGLGLMVAATEDNAGKPGEFVSAIAGRTDQAIEETKTRTDLDRSDHHIPLVLTKRAIPVSVKPRYDNVGDHGYNPSGDGDLITASGKMKYSKKKYKIVKHKPKYKKIKMEVYEPKIKYKKVKIKVPKKKLKKKKIKAYVVKKEHGHEHM